MKKIGIIILILMFLICSLPVSEAVNASAFDPTSAPVYDVKPEISDYFHRQMDEGEYEGEFVPVIARYFGNWNVKYFFCGEMTLLNALDIMSVRATGNTYGLGVVDLLNEYFVGENGEIVANPYGGGTVFYARDGQMTPAGVFHRAEAIGLDTGLWKTELIYGVNTYTAIEPVRKSDLEAIVKIAKEDVFDKGGVLIMHVGRRSGWDSSEDENAPKKWGGFEYFHFITVLDMQMNSDGSARMLIVDSFGSDDNGFVGWVNSEIYTTPGSLNGIMYDRSIFTGIKNIYGVIPTNLSQIGDEY